MSDGEGAPAEPGAGSSGAQLLSQPPAQQAQPAQQEPNSFAERFPWASSAEEEYQGMIESKGWKDINSVLKSYANANKMLGVPETELLRVPKAGDDDGFKSLYDKLGRPEDPSKYDLGDVDDEMSAWYRENAHKVGLSQDQARALFDGFESYKQELQAKMQQQTEADQQSDINALKTEWGREYDTNISAGQRAIARLGLDSESVGKLEAALGTKGVLELAAKIGRSWGEHQMVNGDGGGNQMPFGMTPQAAMHKLEELQADKGWQERMVSDDAKIRNLAIEERRKLIQAVYPNS